MLICNGIARYHGAALALSAEPMILCDVDKRMKMNQYANVIVDISHEKVDRLFQYRLPERLRQTAKVGDEVLVPFGKGDTKRKAYIMELTEETQWEESRIKEIISINEKAVSAEARTLQLAYWMKNNYGSTMITAMKTVLPVKKKIRGQQYRRLRCIAEDEILTELASKCHPVRQAARQRLLREFLSVKELPYQLVTGKMNVAPSTIQSLEKQGVLQVVTTREYRNPILRSDRRAEKPVLSAEQQQAVDGILKSMQETEPGVSLLHGITGSGKTEVYMELIEKNISMGKQAIVLIPEITLTFQTLMRFYARFGDRVSVLHSRLSDGERYDQYERARTGQLDVMIGPRSALFTPFMQLGLIVIDEEHENSYKSEKMPKYHAREVAEYIAKREHAALVLGSATPSMESYYKAVNGEYHLYELKHRPQGAVLPQVYIADMRKELKEGNKSFFSRKLKELMLERLLRGEQIMLFINRRGYAGFVSCRECGFVVKCPHCDVSLSQHHAGGMYQKKEQKLICHYCGYQTDMLTKCPECGSPYIAGFRAGTQRIEEELKKWYPSVRVLRMDADTTRKKEDYEKILSSFAAHEADVLIGTQMIVKGHDFPNTTLVGAIAADLSLSVGDYRAAERTFQLLAQAAGRAGRGEKKGEVVIQTYQPDNYGIVNAAKQDYLSFYQEEILYRRLAGYPPVQHMLAVQVFAKEEAEGMALAEKIAGKISEEVPERMSGKIAEKISGLSPECNGKEQMQLIGPVPAAVARINDIYRTVLYIKHGSKQFLIACKDRIEEMIKDGEQGGQILQFDFDPVNLF